jgi:hypothetical protein
MIPFMLFFNGQILFLAAVFTLTDNQEEEFETFEKDELREYKERNIVFRGYLKTLDFT